jgi:hypothetical protein
MFTTKINRFFVCLTTIELLFLILSGECRLLGSEPIYQGEPESYWVNLLTNLHSLPFANKWRTLGTNAIPVLVKATEKTSGPGAAIIRTNAAFILSQRGDPKVLLPIVNSTSDSGVKMWILNGLVFNGSRDVTEAMVNALRDKDPEVRATAVMGLGLTAREKTDEELPALIKCLQDEDPNVRTWAARVLVHYSYPDPNHPEQNQTNVDALAVSEIKKAVDNPDPHISNAAAIALRERKGRYRVLEGYAKELAIYLSEVHGTKWTATLHVIDDDGKPVRGATASVSYAVPPGPDDEGDSSWKTIEGMTDADGVFTATHLDSSHTLGFDVKKEGYYISHGSYEFAFPGQFDSQRMASNRTPNVTIQLKRIIHPVPMYVNRVDIAHREKPAVDKAVGFDLTVGDFVAPYGKGTNAQMFFTWHVEYVDTNSAESEWVRSRKGWDGRMIISFPNPGDGIQEFDLPGPFDNSFKEKNVASELRSPQLAPVDGYKSQLIKTNRWNFGKLGSLNDYDHLRKNYFLRVNTVLDEKGNVKSAQYGKIYGDFEEALTTYLNPEPNSRELEYDMRHNLGPGGNNFYFTY